MKKGGRTRSQPLTLYTVALLALVVCIFTGVSFSFGKSRLSDIRSPFCHKPEIFWRSRAVALELCQKERKPILYCALFKDDLNSQRLKYDHLRERRIAEYINANFIPVRVDLESVINDETVNPELVKIGRQARLFHHKGFQLSIVPPDMVNFDAADINSSANFAERGIISPQDGDFSLHLKSLDYPYAPHLNESFEPVMFKYDTLAELSHYLFVARNFHRLQPSRGLGNWQALDLLTRTVAGKRRVLFMVDKYGERSDRYRLKVLNSSYLMSRLNKASLPILVEYDNAHPERTAHLDYLKARYRARELPCMVDMDAPGGARITYQDIVHDVDYALRDSKLLTAPPEVLPGYVK